MSDVEPGGGEAPERAENATGTDVLTTEQYGAVGYVTDEGAEAGVFFWNDPTYPANGDAMEVYTAQQEAAAEAVQPWEAGAGELEPA